MRVLLVYPCFNQANGRSIFRFPPLGLGYLAAYLRKDKHEVEILDCTFLDRKTVLEQALRRPVDVVGVNCMFPFHEDSLWFARQLRGKCGLLVAGGPMASCNPAYFTADFDVVVMGEGEKTFSKIISNYERGKSFRPINGYANRSSSGAELISPSTLENDLDSLPQPARELFPNQSYIAYWGKKGAEPTTSVITSRGCPFHCEFCSNAVFGNTYRQRSAENVLDEVEACLRLGYKRIHFADDVFTLKKDRILKICEEIRNRRLVFSWECLCRVDLIDTEMAGAMKTAGCDRVFFGIESGSPLTLKLMKKSFTPEIARQAVETARKAGLRTGAFFILCYPGDTDNSVLDTISFATRLPLDYLSFTLPYPIPGTALYERMKGQLKQHYQARGNIFTEHFLTYDADFSQAKMRLAILKGKAQFWLRKMPGGQYGVRPIEGITDRLFRLMK